MVRERGVVLQVEAVGVVGAFDPGLDLGSGSLDGVVAVGGLLCCLAAEPHARSSDDPGADAANPPVEP